MLSALLGAGFQLKVTVVEGSGPILGLIMTGPCPSIGIAPNGKDAAHALLLFRPCLGGTGR
jgi:hypothetical protein